MVIRARIDGAEGIALVAAAVRRLGSDRTIVNEMAKEIRTAIIPPARTAIRKNAVAYLPSGGGLGMWVAAARITAQVRRGARSAGVTIIGGRSSRGRRSDLRRIDAGQVRHPTYGHKPWVPQSVKAGFFTEAVTDEGVKAFREAVVVAVNRAVKRVL